MEREAAEVFIKRTKQGKDIRGWVNRHKRNADILRGGKGDIEEVPKRKPFTRDLLRIEDQIPDIKGRDLYEPSGRFPSSQPARDESKGGHGLVQEYMGFESFVEDFPYQEEEEKFNFMDFI